MAKSLVFHLGEDEFSFAINKVDRSKLYGSKEVEAFDESDQKCELATLAGDGCTLIGRGGTGLGWLDADGSWRDKSQLTPIDKDGQEIEPVPSSFHAPIQLFETATVEETPAQKKPVKKKKVKKKVAKKNAKPSPGVTQDASANGARARKKKAK